MSDELTAESLADGGEPAAESLTDDTQDGGAPAGQESLTETDKGEAREAQQEDYELSATEDFPMPDDNLKSFSAACKKAGLTRKQAEAVLDWHRGMYREDTEWQSRQAKETRAAWDKAILEDREFGGANYKETVVSARKALAAFDPDGSLRQILRESTWEYNPSVVRALARVGRAMGEHQFADGNGAGKAAPLEDRMYPNM